MKNKNTLCPCGSSKPFTQCCQPIFLDHGRATSAELLLRSRYTAFVYKNSGHLMASWHSRTRPKALNHEDFQVVWLGIEIHEREKGGPEDDSGTIEFTTSYIEKGRLCLLREKSRFLKEQQLWYYLNGTVEIDQKKIERNRSCPCGSGKKFKRCCLHAAQQHPI